ncbi:hypothetical protein NDU88_010094 [Pleurodeles waltl]|uniref:Uncharacterized protein n=1 Tax=Pleurodeles waltl TaxID=8319 RepID=A0AAV7QUY1_PLEWA|nr:hypothetical protein NDU88_010094 [Pleurodeles waltl]
MGKDRANKETQQTRMDQYTAQSSEASLQMDHPGPLEKGAEPTGVQFLAAIESSSRATQTQIAAIAVDVNLLRSDLRVVAECSVATGQQVTCMQSDVDTLKASVAILEAKTRKMEVRVEDAEGESGGRLRETAEVHTEVHRSTRRHRAGRGSRVIVRSDGILSLERWRQESEEAKLLVQTVTSEASSRSRSPCVVSGLSPEGEAEVT